MIEKIRKELLVKYTIIIAAILFVSFVASYSAYKYSSLKFMQEGLEDYLAEESWEAEEFFAQNRINEDSHKIQTDINSFSNFTYWVKDNVIVHAERPVDDEVSKRLENRLLHKDYKDGQIYRENIRYNTQKWRFLLLKKTLKSNTNQKKEVFVLANFTPLYTNAKMYVRFALTALIVIILLAYLIGNLITARSMCYIKENYEKQKQFVSDAAHELRTPLAILTSYTELLEYNSPKNETISDIKDEIQQMSDLLDRLLMMARYDNSTMAPQKKVFNLNQMLQTIIKAMRLSCPNGKFEFIASANNITINADKVMLRQLISILLDNAIKYTHADKHIIISLDKTTTEINIKVKDNGTGIKQEDVKHIFDRFWRADKSRQSKGLGVGLFLADKIVKLHNGKIKVETKLGTGSVFEIILPKK